MYLLDTQVLMWLDSNPQRIGKRTRQILRKAAKVVFSPISLAELRIKETKGQIALGDLFSTSFEGVRFRGVRIFIAPQQ